MLCPAPPLTVRPACPAGGFHISDAELVCPAIVPFLPTPHATCPSNALLTPPALFLSWQMYTGMREAHLRDAVALCDFFPLLPL